MPFSSFRPNAARVLSLRARLVMFALLCAGPVLLLAALQLRQATGEMRSQALLQAEDAAEDLEARMLLLLTGAESLAQAVLAMPTAGCGDALRAALPTAQYVGNYAVLEPDGRVRCSARPVAAGTPLGRGPLLPKVLQRKRPLVTGVPVSRVTHRPTLLLWVPALDAAGAVRAIAVIAFESGELTEGLLAGRSQPLALVMVDAEGRVVGSAPGGREASPGRAVAQSPLYAAMIRDGERQVDATGLDGVRRLYQLRSVKYRGEPVLRIAAGIDVASLEGTMLAQQLRTLAVVLLLGALVATLAVAATRPLVVARYRALLDVARGVAQGRYADRVALTAKDDLTPVEEAFNHMLQAVEDDRALLDLRVRQRTHELETANQELEAFSYTVSHDLRAPVTVIGSFCGVLEERGALASEQDRHYLARVRAAAQRMNELIDGLLVLANVAREPLVWGPVDLTELAREAAQDCLGADPRRAVRVKIDEGMTVRADRRLMRIVLANLLGNAFKFTRNVAVAEISATMQHGAAGEQVICVRDNGAGFDEAYASRLFEAFSRLHKASEFPGLGIGLATVHRIVLRHGGRIWAHGQPGAGATFCFVLGAAQPAPTKLQSRTGTDH